MDVTDNRQKRDKRIGLSLTGMVLVAVLPLLLFGGWVAWTFIDYKKTTVADELINNARALLSSVDHELLSQFAVMDVLAGDASLDAGDLPAFRDRVQRVLRVHGEWDSAVLIDPRTHALVAGALPQFVFGQQRAGIRFQRLDAVHRTGVAAAEQAELGAERHVQIHRNRCFRRQGCEPLAIPRAIHGGREMRRGRVARVARHVLVVFRDQGSEFHGAQAGRVAIVSR